MDASVAATRDDIVNMLRSEKHRSRKGRSTFAMPTRGFDGESTEAHAVDAGRRKDEVASIKLLDDFTW